jgi:acetate kinase
MVRARICNELGFLGIRLDDTANAQSAALISRLDCSVRVRVIRTDEEVVLARHALAVGDTLGLQSPERHSHAARL